MYYIERVNTKTSEERLLNWDNYDRIWRPVSEFRNAEGCEDLAYLQSTAQGMTQMEQIKVQFGMVSEAEFEYNIVQKNDNSYRIDEDGNKVPVEDSQPEQGFDIPPEDLPE